VNFLTEVLFPYPFTIHLLKAFAHAQKDVNTLIKRKKLIRTQVSNKFLIHSLFFAVS